MLINVNTNAVDLKMFMTFVFLFLIFSVGHSLNKINPDNYQLSFGRLLKIFNTNI